MKKIVSSDYLICLFALLLFNGIALSNISNCDSIYWVTALLPIAFLAGFIFWGIKGSNEAVIIKKMLMVVLQV